LVLAGFFGLTSATLPVAALAQTAGTPASVPVPFVPLPDGKAGAAGAPGQAGFQADGTPRKYRNPTSPLTIGEMSDMQAKKVKADFLSKYGYTTIEPPTPAPVAKPTPKATIRAVAVVGSPKGFFAEIFYDGSFRRVSEGTKLSARLTVRKIDSTGVQIELRTPGVKSRKKPKEVVEDVLTTKKVTLGQNVEVLL
jgi:hypothetical protein